MGAGPTLTPLPSLSTLGTRVKHASSACSLLHHESCKRGCANPDTNASQVRPHFALKEKREKPLRATQLLGNSAMAISHHCLWHAPRRCLNSARLRKELTRISHFRDKRVYVEEYHHSFFLAATFLNEISTACALQPALAPVSDSSMGTQVS